MSTNRSLWCAVTLKRGWEGEGFCVCVCVWWELGLRRIKPLKSVSSRAGHQNKVELCLINKEPRNSGHVDLWATLKLANLGKDVLCSSTTIISRQTLRLIFRGCKPLHWKPLWESQGKDGSSRAQVTLYLTGCPSTDQGSFMIVLLLTVCCCTICVVLLHFLVPRNNR